MNKRSRARRTALWLAVLLLAALLAGCARGSYVTNIGGRRDTEPEPSPSPSASAPTHTPSSHMGTHSILAVDRDSGEMTVSRPTLSGDVSGRTPGTWTILVYLCGTDLESDYGAATYDVLEMLDAASSSRVRFVIETGGTSAWYNDVMESGRLQRYLVEDGDAVLVDEQRDASMGAADTLADFLAWGVETYPAEHMGVILWDHGGGSITGVCFDETRYWDSLSLRELNDAFLSVSDRIGKKFDFVGFDACLMSTVETANILASYADYMIASQETEPGSGWAYTPMGDFLASNPDADGAALGKVICDSFLDACRDYDCDDSATLSVIDLSKIDGFLIAFNEFARNMYAAGEDGAVLAEMIRGIESADNYGGNNKSEGYTNMVDLGGLIAACAPYADGAEAALAALEDAVVCQALGRMHRAASGLSVYYPLSVQGSEELSIFGGVCVSPFYLSFVDRQSQGSVDIGSVDTYTDDAWYDEDGAWSWATSADENGETYWSFLDDYVQTGESPLITFEIEPLLDSDGDYWFYLDESGLNYAAAVYGYVYELSADGEDLIELGETLDVRADWSSGFFCDYFDGWWLSLDEGQNLALYIVDYSSDGVVYTSPILLNGELTNLRLRQDVYTGEVVVEGAWDGLDDSGASAREIYKLQDGDVITPLYYAYLGEDMEDGWYSGVDYVVQGEVEVFYDVMEPGDYLYAFCIDDIYGDYYLTDFVLFTVDEYGDVYFDPDSVDYWFDDAA